MKGIYLSARYSRREELIRIRDIINDRLGYVVTSRWIDREQLRPQEFTARGPARAQMNFSDIRNSDEFWAFTGDPGRKGGDRVELGIAISLGIPITVIGPIETAWHAFPGITHLRDFQQILHQRDELYKTAQRRTGAETAVISEQERPSQSESAHTEPRSSRRPETR